MGSYQMCNLITIPRSMQKLHLVKLLNQTYNIKKNDIKQFETIFFPLMAILSARDVLH